MGLLDLNQDVWCVILSNLDNYVDINNFLSATRFPKNYRNFFITCWIQSRQPLLVKENNTTFRTLNPQIMKLFLDHKLGFFHIRPNIRTFDITISTRGTPEHPYGPIFLRIVSIYEGYKFTYLIVEEKDLYDRYFINEALYVEIIQSLTSDRCEVTFMKVKFETQSRANFHRAIEFIDTAQYVRFSTSIIHNEEIIYSANNDWYVYALNILNIYEEHNCLITTNNSYRKTFEGNQLKEEFSKKTLLRTDTNTIMGYQTDYQLSINGIPHLRNLERPKRRYGNIVNLKEIYTFKRTFKDIRTRVQYQHEFYCNNVLESNNDVTDASIGSMKIENIIGLR